MSEERNDLTPRRRRYRNPETAAGSVPAGADSRPATETGHIYGEDKLQIQGPDSRVPEEARRMTAAPYGAVSAAAVRRSSAEYASRQNRIQPSSRIPERKAPDEAMSRVRVGYAPGRMSDTERGGGSVPYRGGTERNVSPYQPSRTREYPESRYQTMPETTSPQRQKRRGRTLLYVLAALLIAAGAFLTVIMVLPEDNDLRQRVTELAGKATAGIRNVTDPETETGETEQTVLPETQQDTGEGEASDTVPSDQKPAESEATMEGPGDPSQADEPGGERAEIPAADETNMTPENEPDGTGENPESGDAENPSDEGTASDETETAEKKGTEEETETVPDPGDTEAGVSDEAPGTDGTEEPETTEGAETSGDEESHEITEEPEEKPDSGETGTEGEDAPGSDEAKQPDEETPGTIAAEQAPEETQGTNEPETTAEPPAKKPVLTAEAAPGANPSLIAQTAVYDGKKKLSEYNRAAKDQIHMPSGWEYSKREIGVLTFRGNAFRTNGAAGTAVAVDELNPLWEKSTGSVKGSGQVYSGTGWPGQPAIVQWSRQVRESSEIYQAKKETKKLIEVIVPGMDGNIRFLDLEDGELTRNSIKPGYPMAGTPSVHPSGYPYMSVGQYARKLKNKTGKIGLRQYNLYTEEDLSLIDGLDTKLKRAFNNIGSFETSALIDRTSDTMITLGTNGLLYLVSLNSEFDYQIGIYKSKPDTIVMRSRTKGQKNALTAVESSPAMYDKYIFYADMGGILRCVDTNFLTPIWAVETGDSVMAAIALEERNGEALDLYTANMLNNRKSGDVQIRRFDALTGKETWCVNIGVKKDKKNNKIPIGCKASPVIGEKNLSGIVYFTVSGLSAEGQTKLHVPEETKAALVALDKETGSLIWSYALSDRSESSPIAVYDENGNGRIIQCAWDGSVVMLDGLSGNLLAGIQLEGNIEASPAAFNSIMVIGTTGSGQEKIYGIGIGIRKEEKETTEEVSTEEVLSDDTSSEEVP